MADNKIQVLLEVDDRGTASLQRFGREVQAVGNTGRTSFGQVQQASAATTTSLTTLGTAARAMGTALAAVGVAQFAKSAFDTAISLDSMNRALTAVYGSTTSASAEMEFLRATAARTGQDVYALVGSYTQLSASTKGTALEGENTRKVFASISEAAAVLGLSNETTGRAFTALSQMASKGTISMEELRGQLGEALPGALNLFAKGMGIGTGELIELISQGKVGAAELTKFADAVHEAYGAAAETAALESGQAAVNRLSQAWTEFKANVVDVSAIVGAINFVAGALQGLSTALNRAKQQAADEVAAMAGEVDATRVQMWTRQLEIAEEKIAKINSTPIDIQSQDDRDRLVELNSEVGRLKTGLDIVGGSKAAVKEVMDGFDTGYQSVQTLNGAFGETPPLLDSVSESAINVAEAYGKQDAALGSLAPRVNDAIFSGEKLSLAELDLSRKTDESAESAKEAAKAVKAAATEKREAEKASKAAARAAKDLAREQERLAKEAEDTGRAMIKAAADQRAATAELDKALFDTADAYETLGLTSRKSYEDQVQQVTDAYQRILSIEDLTDSERQRLREGLQTRLIELEDDYRGKAEETIGAIGIAWEDLTEDTKQVLHDWVESAIKMEFDSIGEAFEGLAESILNVWIDLLAKMIAEWAISGIASLFSGGNLLGGISSGLGGLLGDIPVVGGLFKSGDKMMDWGLNALGGSALAAGGASLLGGGGGAGIGAALGGGVSAGAAALFPSVFDAGAAATSFGAGAAEAFGSALIGGPTAGGLEWAAIPGKEFFGTGASQGAAASGAGIGTAAAFGGMAAFAGGLYALASMTATPWQSITSPTLGIGVDMPIHGGYGESDARRRASTLLDIESGLYDPTAGGGGDTIGMGSLAEFDLKPIIEDARGLLDILANGFGDGLASLALQLDGSVAATDRMLDAAAGYDVALSSSAEITDLAAAAAGGSETAMHALRSTLMMLGLSEQQTETAMLGLIAATGSQTSALQTATSAASAAAGAVSGMTSNINTLSRTPLNIRVRASVDLTPYGGGDDYMAPRHAAGGIFSGPTLIPSIRGTRHLVGEAGAEAIMPLHDGPGTLKKMDAKLDALLSGGRPVQHVINLDGRQIASATLPYVDAHVAGKASRGALTKRTVF